MLRAIKTSYIQLKGLKMCVKCMAPFIPLLFTSSICTNNRSYYNHVDIVFQHQDEGIA